MISLYAMLFDDDTFEKENALVFNWNPIFFGMGPESFVYSRETLQAAIIDEMEKNEWKGVCCEPNCVFVVCNQFPVNISSSNSEEPAITDNVIVDSNALQ